MIRSTKIILLTILSMVVVVAVVVPLVLHFRGKSSSSTMSMSSKMRIYFLLHSPSVLLTTNDIDGDVDDETEYR